MGLQHCRCFGDHCRCRGCAAADRPGPAYAHGTGPESGERRDQRHVYLRRDSA
ncbi:MAG: hypothetical protein ACK55Z_30900 [bacterium]